MAVYTGNKYANVKILATGTSGSGYTIPMTTTTATWTVANPTDARVNISNGDIFLEGVSLKDTLAGIQSRLGILRPDPALEESFEEMRRLGDAYRKAQKHFEEQKKVFDILKNTDKK